MASISPIPAEQMVAQALPAANLHGARRGDCFDVLILDDDPFDQKRLLRTLESTGLPVNTVSAATIREFDAALDAGSFDVVLIDYLLPDSDGLAAQKMVQSHPTNFAAAVVMMSNKMRTDVAIESIKQGSLDCLDKVELSTDKLRELMMASVKVLAETSRHWIGELLAQQRTLIAQDVAKLVRDEMEFGRLIDTIDKRILDMLAARGLTLADRWDADGVMDPDPPFAFR
ncbi:MULTISPECIES: response regulator [Roseovarius]|jgi:DNA-binding NtrC family response regulator|uniref:response regulator n=1 Tax=Roseovarius TaxID=74030 RepID=UPI00273D8CB3|nr:MULTISPECIES: response regulator [unclassified Roseovarius]